MNREEIPSGPEWRAFLAERLGTNWAISTGRKAQRLIAEGKASLTVGPSYYRRLQQEFIRSHANGVGPSE